MAKGVLGNDPFLRGAAVRPEDDKPAAQPPAKSKKARPTPAPVAAASTRKPARAAAKDAAPAAAPGAARAPRAAEAPKAAKTPRASEAPRAVEAPKAARPPKASEASKAPRKGPPKKSVPAPAPAARQAPAAQSLPVEPERASPAPVAAPAPAVAAPAPVEPVRMAPEAIEAPQPAVAESAVAPEARPEPVVQARAQEPEASPAPAAPVHEVPPAAAQPQGAAPQAASRYEEAVVLSPEEAQALEAAAAERRTLRLVAGGRTSEQEAGEGQAYRAEARGVLEGATGALALAREVMTSTLQSPGLLQAARVSQGLVNAVRSGLGVGGSREVDAYGRDPALVRELGPLADFLYSRYWRVGVQGAVHVPSGPVLLVANHSGALPFDGPVLHQALSRERPDLLDSRWLVEDQVFHAPFFGTLLNRLGALRACPENATRLLEEGRPVIVFPEGAQGLGKPFRERYQLKRFGRGGFIKLALRARVPVVPVAIVGAEETTPLLARLPLPAFGLSYLPLTPLGPLPLPARWSLRFGEPLDLEGLGPEAADNLGVVQRLTERTREAIQGMLQALLRERKGVFTG